MSFGVPDTHRVCLCAYSFVLMCARVCVRASFWLWLVQLYRPRAFLLSTRFPVVLNTVFVTLAYAGGLPILIPIGFLSLVMSYWVDKVTLLRLYAKPPYMEEDLALVRVAVAWPCVCCSSPKAPPPFLPCGCASFPTSSCRGRCSFTWA